VAEAGDFLTSIIDALKKNQLQIPTLPEVAVKVRQAVDRDGASAADIAKIVSADPAISARLLQVANSPLYRGSKAIESVQNAIARLGNKTVRSLVTSLVTQQLFQTKSAALKQRMERLWMHSTEVAAFSMVLARRFTKLDPEEALLAGLLHDIGAVPLITQAEKHEEIAANPAALDEAIEKLHTSVGKLILETWKFPKELSQVAAEHENLSRKTDGPVDMVDLVMVANLHAHLGTGHRLGKVNWGEVPAFAKLGMTPEQSIKAMEEAKAEAAQMQALLRG
jgi:putative nucleotidyltransferase with HDIG domain